MFSNSRNKRVILEQDGNLENKLEARTRKGICFKEVLKVKNLVGMATIIVLTAIIVMHSLGKEFMTFPLDKNFVLGQGFYYDDGKYHGGIDYFTNHEIGKAVLATDSGKITHTQDDYDNTYPKQWCYGNYIIIQHPNGYKTLYAHLLKNNLLVHEGDEVQRGQVIALSGNSGYSTGPHLHFELRKNNDKIDPYGIYLIYGTNSTADKYTIGNMQQAQRSGNYHWIGLPPQLFSDYQAAKDASFQKFRNLTDQYLNSPYSNPRYYNGNARGLVGNPLYEQRESGNKYKDYWSFLIPTDKGWSLAITYTPGATPEEDKYLAPYPVAIAPELVGFYKAHRGELGSPLCDTILGRVDGVMELPCYRGNLKRNPNGQIFIDGYKRGFVPGGFEKPPVLRKESFWIVRAYNYHFGELGCGYAENEAHDWHDVGVVKIIQDFNGGGANDSAIITNPAYDQAFLIGNAFWQFYANNPEERRKLTVPSTPEIAEKRSILQGGFEIEQETYQLFYGGYRLSWGQRIPGDNKCHVWMIEDNNGNPGGGGGGDPIPPQDGPLPIPYLIAQGSHEKYYNSKPLIITYVWPKDVNLEPVTKMYIQMASDAHFNNIFYKDTDGNLRQYTLIDDGSGRYLKSRVAYIHARSEREDGPNETRGNWSETLYICIDFDPPKKPSLHPKNNQAIISSPTLVWDFDQNTIKDDNQGNYFSGLKLIQGQIALNNNFTQTIRDETYGTGKLSLVLENAKPDQAYYARIRLEDNAENYSPWSDAVKIVYKPAEEPPPPTTLPTPSLTLDPSGWEQKEAPVVRISWDNADQTELSQIEYLFFEVRHQSNDPAFYTEKSFDLNSFQFMAVEDGQIYHILCQARNDSLNIKSDWSNKVFFQINLTPEPPPIVTLPTPQIQRDPKEGEDGRSYDFSLIWQFTIPDKESIEAGIKQIQAQVAREDAGFNASNLVLDTIYGAGKVSIVLNAEEEETKYYARVRIEDNNGNLSDWSINLDDNYLFYQPNQGQVEPPVRGNKSNIFPDPSFEETAVNQEPPTAVHWKNVPGYIKVLNHNANQGQKSCELHNDTADSGGQVLEYQFDTLAGDQIQFSCFIQAETPVADWHTVMAIQQAGAPYTTYIEQKADQGAIGHYSQYSLSYTSQQMERLTAQIKLRNGQGTIWVDDISLIIQPDIQPDSGLIWRGDKTGAALLPNYPNPFNPETWIPFQIAERGEAQIQIFNQKGRLVKSFNLGCLNPGFYTQHWDGRDGNNETVSTGVYFYSLSFKNGQKLIRKMVILK